ncbi:hypothetical protein PHMEG_00039893 [Phytophthora megakarya]|uniref:Uncharacterized protein n=1 Tax=Phytophthora megakarya TaxID=4795 RepID=A0A225UEI6_9STRA|nr:hypothetical protein PHMEG_00039893 [Phytophthora megakarya]
MGIRIVCVLAYAGPELRTRNQDNPQCMTSMIHDEPVPLDIRQSVSGPPFPPEPEGKPEFKLNPGERYGWWVENDREEERRQCATVHGAVNNFRTQILLDTERL